MSSGELPSGGSELRSGSSGELSSDANGETPGHTGPPSDGSRVAPSGSSEPRGFRGRGEPGAEGGRLRAIRRAVWRVLRPPRILRPTRAGWCFFVLICGVAFAALNTGNNLLYLVLSLLLAFLALSGVLSESALRGVRIRRRLPSEIHAGASGDVWLEIANEQPRSTAFALCVSDRLPGGAEAGRVFALSIGPGERVLRRYALRPEARGPLALRGFEVATRFPFGLFEKSRWIPLAEELLVFPRIEPVTLPELADTGAARGERERPAAAWGANVVGLREFQPGDGLRRVHWRASLRRDTLVVRSSEEERDRDVVLHLNPAAAPGDAFEAAVVRCASRVVAHLAAGHRVGLRCGDEHFPPAGDTAQRRSLLAFLARVEARGGARADAGARAA